MARTFLTPIDLAQNELQNAVIQNLAADPAVLTSIKGQQYYNSVANEMRIFDGTAWVPVGGVAVPPPAPATVAPVAENVLGAAVVAPAVGVAVEYARADHTHGSPAALTAADIAPLAPVQSVTGSNGVAAVDTAGAVAVSAVVDPATDAALTVSAAGIKLDPAAAGSTIPSVADIDAEVDVKIDDFVISTNTGSLSASKTGTSAGGDLNWLLTLDSLTLANTYSGVTDPITTPPVGVTPEPGDLYIDTVAGLAYIYDGTAWIALATAGAGVMGITAGNGIAVDSTNPNSPTVSAVIDPASDTLLTNSATGLKLDPTVVSQTELDAAIAALPAATVYSAGAGLLDNVSTPGTFDVVAADVSLNVAADAVRVQIDPAVGNQLTLGANGLLVAPAAAGLRVESVAIPGATSPEGVVHTINSVNVQVQVFSPTDVLVDTGVRIVSSAAIEIDWGTPPGPGYRAVIIGG